MDTRLEQYLDVMRSGPVRPRVGPLPWWLGSPDSLILATPQDCFDGIKLAQRVAAQVDEASADWPLSLMRGIGEWLSLRYTGNFLDAPALSTPVMTWDLDDIATLVAGPPLPIDRVTQAVIDNGSFWLTSKVRDVIGHLGDPDELAMYFDVQDVEPHARPVTSLGATWQVHVDLLKLLSSEESDPGARAEFDRLVSLARGGVALPPDTVPAAQRDWNEAVEINQGHGAFAPRVAQVLYQTITELTPAAAEAEAAEVDVLRAAGRLDPGGASRRGNGPPAHHVTRPARPSQPTTPGRRPPTGPTHTGP